MKRRALDWLDRWVQRHEQIRPIGRGGYIMQMKKACYRGPGLVLADGTAVNSGDPVGELHLDNQRAAASASHRGTVSSAASEERGRARLDYAVKFCIEFMRWFRTVNPQTDTDGSVS